ncbi:caspase family protein [Streptomyces sp. DSM 44915]|uniref:Caspase family protein n=1 Tax=Streptomyces chisholmiae TaxID=3075540 RepID=A0ABU2JZ93_9ACTN|nr:caspase family protein [Streptomyces sp. DSM 44915]MDT0270325.1 caspase family protein [Streptomyces sp. DSM 44915]
MAQVPDARRSRVLLIGAAEYRDPTWGDIPGVAHNLRGLRDELLGQDEAGRAVPSTCELSHSRDREAVLNAVRRAADTARDLLLVYFSGHGQLHFDTRRGSTELLLVPADCPRERVWEHAIPYSWLRDTVRSSPARRVVLILDCCHSGQAHREHEPGRTAFALLTSCRAHEDQDRGDGLGPTPFTRALLTVLRAHRLRRQPLTVAELHRKLRLLAGRAAQRAAADADSHRNDWAPRLTASAAGATVVLSHVAQGPEPGPLARLAARRQRFRATWGHFRERAHWRPLAGLVLLALLLPLGAGGLLWDRWRERDAAADRCRVPLQLRVLTTPEYQQPLARALSAFQPDPAAADLVGPGPRDCRRVEVQVYGAPGAAVVDAFGHSADWVSPGRPCAPPAPASATDQPCRELPRDVGPLPDVWLPASATAVDRARPATLARESRVDLGEATELARTPAVLAVAGELAGVARTGEPLARLLAAAGDGVRHAAPHSSDAALLHGLRAGRDWTPDPEPAPDDQRLLCGLSPDEPTPHLLLAERSMLPLVGESPAPCLPEGGWRVGLGERYTAYYPVDVPPLDLTFVPVSWRDADRDVTQRRAAVELLRTWLTSDAGRAALTAEGFRQREPWADGFVGDPELLNRRPFVHGLPAPAEPADAAAVAEYLAAGAADRAPRRVVFVLDVSASVLGADGRLAVVRDTLRQAVGALTAEDEFAVVSMPGPGGAAVGVPRDLGPPDASGIDGLLAELAPVRGEVALEVPIAEADRLLAGRGRGAATEVLVLITDDGHRTDASAALAAADVDSTLVVSVLDGGCDRSPVDELTRADSCLDEPGGQPVALATWLRGLGEG